MSRFYWGRLDCPQTPSTRTAVRPGPRGQRYWLGLCADRFVQISLLQFDIAVMLRVASGTYQLFCCQTNQPEG
jgi:hypothetical protein